MSDLQYSFRPWREGNGTRVRLSDAGWKEPLKWSKQAVKAAEFFSQPGDNYERPRVVCKTDVFEDWDGPILDYRGFRLRKNAVGKYVSASNLKGERWATMDDLRADLFRLIDATPNLDWLLSSKKPKNIRRMIELRVRQIPEVQRGR